MGKNKMPFKKPVDLDYLMSIIHKYCGPSPASRNDKERHKG